MATSLNYNLQRMQAQGIAPKVTVKDVKPKAADLIMMNVPEKLEYMEKRKVALKLLQAQRGISEEKQEELRQKNIHPSDLKFLPACQVKKLLQKEDN